MPCHRDGGQESCEAGWNWFEILVLTGISMIARHLPSPAISSGDRHNQSCMGLKGFY